MICPFVGGGFGCKGNTWTPATLAAMAAKMVGRPVKLVITRPQMFYANGYRPKTIQKLRFAADANGHLVSMRHDGISQTSNEDLGEFSEPVALATEMLYDCANVAVRTGSSRWTPACRPICARPVNRLAISPSNRRWTNWPCTLLDPVELRLRNYAEPTSTRRSRSPARCCASVTRRGPPPSDGSAAPRSRAPCATGAGWSGWGWRRAPIPPTTSPPARRCGSARTARCVSARRPGPRHRHLYGDVALAADILGVPLRWVRFELGDSILPHAPVSGGPTVPSVGPAVYAACRGAAEGLRHGARRCPARLEGRAPPKPCACGTASC